ncbi:MAG: DMT family transporter [Lentisphaeria bacterium]|nr:DMT family transporter [Lentisphaeria bacterium]
MRWSRWTVFAMLLGSMALWGGTWPVGRMIAGSLAPFNAAFLRFLMATAGLAGLCLLTGGRRSLAFPRRLFPRLLLLGATGIFGYSFLFFTGLKTTAAARGGLIIGCIPVCIAIAGAVMARRRPSASAMGGILLSLLGVAFVMTRGVPLDVLRGQVKAGDLMILGCVVCWTAYTLLAKPVMAELSPLVTVTWSCFFGVLLMLPFAISGGVWRDVPGIRPRDWLGLFYLGILATSFAYHWYYKAIHSVGPVAAGIFINLVPLFALLFSVVFLKETVHVSQLVGGLMVIAGVVVTAMVMGSRRGEPAAWPDRQRVGAAAEVSGSN